ncbi:hypothetical protein BKA65DRAFT_141203 [Rhexocercosporidium sp. MPI-PUGE-AT-0058]|nr:hypothetical protein BKA65DRAFT_141203 [Rhexocercosporidium sp. MPI-PUGE-AT-0058]
MRKRGSLPSVPSLPSLSSLARPPSCPPWLAHTLHFTVTLLASLPDPPPALPPFSGRPVIPSHLLPVSSRVVQPPVSQVSQSVSQPNALFEPNICLVFNSVVDDLTLFTSTDNTTQPDGPSSRNYLESILPKLIPSFSPSSRDTTRRCTTGQNRTEQTDKRTSDERSITLLLPRSPARPEHAPLPPKPNSAVNCLRTTTHPPTHRLVVD